MSDPVNHPEHYTSGGVEVIDAIEAWGLGYHLGNAVKYIARAGKKTPDPREDIAKAVWYLQRELERLGVGDVGCAGHCAVDHDPTCSTHADNRPPVRSRWEKRLDSGLVVKRWVPRHLEGKRYEWWSIGGAEMYQDDRTVSQLEGDGFRRIDGGGK